jgi:23S rRNA pseudouridine2605 synthase
MFERIGHPVSKLARVAIGPIRDEKLLPGAHRKLTGAEIRALRESVRTRSPRHPGGLSPHPS